MSEHQRRIVICASRSVVRWVEEELAGTPCVPYVAASCADAIAAVISADPRCPAVLVVDLDMLTPPQRSEFAALDDHGWYGTFVALGDVSPVLEAALGITHVIRRPLGSEALRSICLALREGRDTVRMQMP